MKIYIHSDSPALTVVVQWENNKEGEIKDLVDIFCRSLHQKYPSLNNSGANFSILSSTGKYLKYDEKVSQTLKNKDDVFIKIEGPTNISQYFEAVTLSESSCSIDKTLSDPEKNLEQNAQQAGRNLDGKRNAALVHMCNQRLRKAINIYQELLTTDENDLNALKGLIRCYLKAERPKDALKHCKVALGKEKQDTDILALAGETYIKIRDGEAAVDCLLKLCKILRQKGMATASEKQDIQVLVAKAYLVENQQDMAITVLQGVLRENVEHADALAEYAALLFTIGTAEHKEEAISAILSALANKRNDKNIKQKFSEMMITEDGMTVLKKLAANILTDASALLFLGITVREFGAIEQTLEFLELAYKAEPSSVCILTYIHTLELLERHVEALSHLLQHCRTFPEKGVGSIQFADLIPYLENINQSFTEVKAPCISLRSKTGIVSSTPYTEEDLYVLALFFTVVKIFYIKGLLSILPPILQLLQPFCEGRDLHLTLIRNEAAYFKCINEVFKSLSVIPETVIREDRNDIYFIGDSHCIPVAWRQVTYKGAEYTLYPVLSTGTKIWHLRPDSVFYPKRNFESVIKIIPDGAVVTTCLGEIDCRESFLQCWEKAKYDTIEEAMEVVVDIYIQLLKGLQKKHNWIIYVHPVLPVLDLTRPIVLQFNRILATKLLAEPSLRWMNFVNDLLTADGQSLKDEFKLDGTHMHPSYLNMFMTALNQH